LHCFQLEDEPYNPDYVEVDRVLDMAEHTDPNTGKTIKHYLVKWRSMQYEDSTWELEEDVDPVKIQQYENNNKRPPKEKWKVRVPQLSLDCDLILGSSFILLRFRQNRVF